MLLHFTGSSNRQQKKKKTISFKDKGDIIFIVQNIIYYRYIDLKQHELTKSDTLIKSKSNQIFISHYCYSLLCNYI